MILLYLIFARPCLTFTIRLPTAAFRLSCANAARRVRRVPLIAACAVSAIRSTVSGSVFNLLCVPIGLSPYADTATSQFYKDCVHMPVDTSTLGRLDTSNRRHRAKASRITSLGNLTVKPFCGFGKLVILGVPV